MYDRQPSTHLQEIDQLQPVRAVAEKEVHALVDIINLDTLCVVCVIVCAIVCELCCVLYVGSSALGDYRKTRQ